MTKGARGFDYENQVIAKLKALGICGPIQEGAGASAADADAEFIIGGQRHKLEVKLNDKAQMGGSSVSYTMGAEQVACTQIHGSIARAIEQSVKSKQEEFDKLLEFVKTNYRTSIIQYPFTCPKELWDEAAAKGLLVNTHVGANIRFLSSHYNNKGIHYIQIGGKGLAYMGRNPAKLPIPSLHELARHVNIELRTARSGSKKNKDGIKMVGVGIRAQGRLLSGCGSSNVSIDNPDSLRKAIKYRNQLRSTSLSATFGLIPTHCF